MPFGAQSVGTVLSMATVTWTGSAAVCPRWAATDSVHWAPKRQHHSETLRKHQTEPPECYEIGDVNSSFQLPLGLNVFFVCVRVCSLNVYVNTWGWRQKTPAAEMLGCVYLKDFFSFYKQRLLLLLLWIRLSFIYRDGGKQLPLTAQVSFGMACGSKITSLFTCLSRFILMPCLSANCLGSLEVTAEHCGSSSSNTVCLRRPTHTFNLSLKSLRRGSPDVLLAARTALIAPQLSRRVGSVVPRSPQWASKSRTAALCLPQVARHRIPGPPPQP